LGLQKSYQNDFELKLLIQKFKIENSISNSIFRENHHPQVNNHIFPTLQCDHTIKNIKH